MNIVIGSDNFGYSFKLKVVDRLLDAGYSIVDIGTHNEYEVNLVDIAVRAGKTILTGQYERAILIGNSGIGMAIASNKIHGIYAAVCNDIESSEDSIINNNCNVMCIDLNIVNTFTAEKLIDSWISLKHESNTSFCLSLIKRIETEPFKVFL
jgi:ribose 5-phosphate isomerase B